MREFMTHEEGVETYLSFEHMVSCLDNALSPFGFELNKNKMIKKYVKKPVEIEAMRLIEPNTPLEVIMWCKGKPCGVGDVGKNIWIEIKTLEGVMKANYGDYIIKGIKGEFYPCKPDIFKATYEEIKE